ncbi:MAG TPA: DUF305 domain-containing protein [Gemmatimonadaceae bacterium]
MLRSLASAVAVVALAACATAKPAMAPPPGIHPAPTPATSPNDPYIRKAQADSARLPYTAADIRFMSGMISHHAQAIAMSEWAPSHGASPAVLRLTERIINAQGDEIHMMQTWLRDRRQPIPPADPKGMTMMMGGMEHTMLMPGMLTEEQMHQLDAARGAEFDRLFLTFMIQHHRGAVSMVRELFGTPGAGQDETVFKFASDVNVDQTTEITRMAEMLVSLGAP